MNKERKRMIERIRRQRNRLVNKGAYSSEIYDYMGIPSKQKIGKLTDTELEKITNKLNNAPRVTVINGNIYPIEYISRFDVWFKGEQQPLKKGFKQAMSSRLMTEYKNKNELIKAKRDFDKMRQKQYAEQLVTYFGNSGEVWEKKIERMSTNKFKEFLERSQGILDFERLFYVNKELDLQVSDAIHMGLDITSYIEGFLTDLDRVYKSVYR